MSTFFAADWSDQPETDVRGLAEVAFKRRADADGLKFGPVYHDDAEAAKLKRPAYVSKTARPYVFAADTV